MSTRFLTITEAITVTGKSRRTLGRLANRLAKDHPEQVVREKTAKGYIWRISEQSLQQAFGAAQPESKHPVADTPTPPGSIAFLAFQDKYLEVTHQGYVGLLAMHQEVKQSYEERLKEKDQRIVELTRELAQVKQPWWRWVWGR
jgi:hypothetical protein